MTVDGHAASEALPVLVQALGSYQQSCTGSGSLRVVGVVRGRDQWPISVQVTVTKVDWRTPRTFEVHFTAEDAGGVASAELGAVLATNVLTLIEEWLAIGPVSGINEV